MFRRLALTVLVVAALAPALRGDAAAPVLVQPGVTIAGVPVGGMTNDQAQAALRPAFARPIRLVYGDRSWRLRPTRFGAKVAIADGAGRASRRAVARTRANALALRARDRDPARGQPAALLPGDEAGAHVRRRNGPGDLSNPCRDVRHRRQAAQPLVDPAGLRVGQG